MKHNAIKTCGGVNVEIHVCLTSALVGGEWAASRSAALSPGKELGPIGWVDPRSRYGRHGEVKFLLS
jgi:hypothetical protein